MAARTTVADVQDILETDLSTDALTAHIEAASFLVDDVEATSDFTTARLELIERYLAAHFATVQEPRISRESIGSGTWEYDIETDYLDTALSLDTTDTLGATGETDTTPSINVLDSRGTD